MEIFQKQKRLNKKVSNYRYCLGGNFGCLFFYMCHRQTSIKELRITKSA